MDLADLVGDHVLTAVEFDGNDLLFELDGVVYKAEENPDDGYRSMMRDISVVNVALKNRFAPIRVSCTFDETPGHDTLEMRADGKIIMRVGTDY